jgi:hypothetical protein
MQGISWLKTGELLAIQEGFHGALVACPGTKVCVCVCISSCCSLNVMNTVSQPVSVLTTLIQKKEYGNTLLKADSLQCCFLNMNKQYSE